MPLSEANGVLEIENTKNSIGIFGVPEIIRFLSISEHA